MNTQLVEDICSKGYHIIDGFLPETDACELHKHALALYHRNQFRNAKIGHLDTQQLAREIRGDAIFWLEEDAQDIPLSAYFTRIKELCTILNHELFLGINEVEAHYAIYPRDSFYKRHVDQFKDNCSRQISCVYYLNPNWQPESAGYLHLFTQENQPLTAIAPKMNRFVCFKSDLPHEVDCTKTERISIAAWLKSVRDFFR